MLLTMNQQNCAVPLELVYFLLEKASNHSTKLPPLDANDLATLKNFLLADVTSLRQLMESNRRQSTASSVDSIPDKSGSTSSLTGVDSEPSTMTSECLQHRLSVPSLATPYGAINTSVMTSAQTQQQQQQPAVNVARYKTELCRQFEENGTCRYADKCQFAHGRAEVRSLTRHPKYKTEMCRTFHTTGFCPYGLRCHFIHNDEERLLLTLQRCQAMSTSDIEPTHNGVSLLTRCSLNTELSPRRRHSSHQHPNMFQSVCNSTLSTGLHADAESGKLTTGEQTGPRGRPILACKALHLVGKVSAL